MGTEISTPRLDRKSVLTMMQPLSGRSAPHDFQEHKKRLVFELEVVSRKFDRFGWDRLSEAMKARLGVDWCDALCEYPMAEVRKAIAAAIKDKPNKCPNEGHVLGHIQAYRARALASASVSTGRPETKEERAASDASRPARDAINPARAAFAKKVMQETASKTGLS